MEEMIKAKILIAEDNQSNTEFLVRALRSNVSLTNIKLTDTAETAVEAINDFYPDIVLLDLKLPRKKGNEPNIDSAAEILKEIELHNYKKNRFIRVIVISGSVQDTGVQQLILGDRSNIVKFLDKNAIAIDSEEFKEKLLKLIGRSLTEDVPERTIDYSVLRKSTLQKLETLHPSLWKKMNSEILDEFETLNARKVNVHARAKQIIGACGEVVEDIIALLKDESLDLSAQQYSDDFNSVRRKLTSLTGRKKIHGSIGYEMTGSDILINRSSAEYATQAYYFRSQALHGKVGDDNNDNLFKSGYSFSREDAAISLNLIIPLVNDFIEYLDTKSKKK